MSLETFSSSVPLSSNATNNREVYTLDNFAIQVEDVDYNSFEGEAFSVDLGTVEEAINRTNEIDENRLVTMMEALSNATASLQVPSTIFNDDAQNVTQRLSYSVFTTDKLFQSEETASGDLTVGSIIVGVKVAPRDGNTTQRTTDNDTTMLEEEIVLTFQKNVSYTHIRLLLHNYLHVYSLC